MLAKENEKQEKEKDVAQKRNAEEIKGKQKREENQDVVDKIEVIIY